jgi:3-oxoacyl-[acyl-carrier protein] reductase
MVDTPMKIDASPEEYELCAQATAVGRIAQPIDIARVALFFAQEHTYATGQNIIVDGGATTF